MSKRSFNGCWTCRSRKVKCDLSKPLCLNCRRRGLECEYGIKLTWTLTQSFPSGVKPDEYFLSEPIELEHSKRDNKRIRRSTVDFVEWSKPYETYEEIDEDLRFNGRSNHQQKKGPFTMFRAVPQKNKEGPSVTNATFLQAHNKHLEFATLPFDDPDSISKPTNFELKNWTDPSLIRFKNIKECFEKKTCVSRSDLNLPLLSGDRIEDYSLDLRSLAPLFPYFEEHILPKLCCSRNGGRNYWEMSIWPCLKDRAEKWVNHLDCLDIVYYSLLLISSYSSFNLYYKGQNNMLRTAILTRKKAVEDVESIKNTASDRECLLFHFIQCQLDSTLGLDASKSFNSLSVYIEKLSIYDKNSSTNLYHPALDDPSVDPLLAGAIISITSFNAMNILDLSGFKPMKLFEVEDNQVSFASEPVIKVMPSNPDIEDFDMVLEDFTATENIPLSLQKNINDAFNYIYRSSEYYNIDAEYESNDTEDPPPPSFEVVFSSHNLFMSHELPKPTEQQAMRLDLSDPKNAFEISLGMPLSLAKLFSLIVELIKHRLHAMANNTLSKMFDKISLNVEEQLLNWKLPWELYYEDQSKKKCFYTLDHEILYHNSMAFYYALTVYYFTMAKDMPISFLRPHVAKALGNMVCLKYVLKKSHGKRFTELRPNPFMLFAVGVETTEIRAQETVKELSSFYEEAYQQDHFTNGWLAKQTMYETWRLRREYSSEQDEISWTDVVNDLGYILS